MDLQTSLVYVGVVVISAVVILLVSMFGIKEKSYEEAIAEQRKLPDDLLLGKKDKGKEKKHKNKTGKKVKEKKEEREEKEEKEEKEHVQFEEAPQILPPDLPVQEACKGNKKKNKPDKVKPILINKDELPIILADSIASQSIVPEVNHFELIHPKDDFELIRSHSKENLNQLTQSDSGVNKSPRETPTKSKKVPKLLQKDKPSPVIEAPPPPPPNSTKDQTSISNPTPSPAPLKESSKKSKKKNDILAQIGGDRDGINVSLLMPLVQKAELSRSEIQILIDQLLNKQLDNPLEHSEWTEGRTDPVIKLKKQLAEKDKALAEEHEASVTFQNKLKELRAELNSERSRLTSSVKQLEEALNNKITEAQTLHTRMQHILESHAAEKQGFSRQIEQLQAKVNEDASIIHKMKEDQGQTQGHLQQELMAQRKQLEVHIAQMREKENALNAQLTQKHVECQELQNMNMTMTQELQATCESSTAEIEMLRQQLGMMQEQYMHAEGQLQHYKEASDRLQELARQLEESHRTQADLDLRLKNAHRHESELQKQIHCYEAELKMVKNGANEASALSGELAKVQSELMKVKNEAAEVGSLRILVNSKEEDLKKTQAEVKKLESSIGELTAELGRTRAELQKIQEEGKKDKNEIRVLGEKLMKASVYVKTADEATGELQVVRAELEKLQNGDKGDVHVQLGKLQEDNCKLLQQIGQLQREVKQMREENEELSAQVASTVRPAAEGRENGVEEKNEKIRNLESGVVKQRDVQISELRAELSNKEAEYQRLRELVEGLKGDVKSQHGVRKELEEELEAQRSKNNDNFDKIKEAEQASTKSLLQRIFPDIEIHEKSYDKWINAFEERVSIVMTQIKNNNAQDINTDIENKNKNLQSTVSHYKQIIVDTEGMLKDLQSHVESEESRWQSELRLKENEITNLRVEIKEMQSKTNVNDKLQEKISNLESRLAAEEASRDEAKAELFALKSAHKSVKGGANLANLEQLHEEKQRLTEELQTERTKRASLDSELSKEKNLVSQLQTEVARLKSEVCGASSSSDQSAVNGPPSDTSKPEQTRTSESLIAAIEKTLIKSAESDNCTINIDNTILSTQESDNSSLTSELNTNNFHTTVHDTQTSWNGQQQKKHKKKRKGGSGKK